MPEGLLVRARRAARRGLIVAPFLQSILSVHTQPNLKKALFPSFVIDSKLGPLPVFVKLLSMSRPHPMARYRNGISTHSASASLIASRWHADCPLSASRKISYLLNLVGTESVIPVSSSHENRNTEWSLFKTQSRPSSWSHRHKQTCCSLYWNPAIVRCRVSGNCPGMSSIDKMAIKGIRSFDSMQHIFEKLTSIR